MTPTEEQSEAELRTLVPRAEVKPSQTRRSWTLSHPRQETASRCSMWVVTAV